MQGTDKTSGQVREALELLIDAALSAEYARTNVILLASYRASIDR
jgi:hypothetical protein